MELIDNPLLKSYECSVIFITAASDMQTCSHAMRSGAFDYLIKPVFFQRLHASLERFMRFIHTVQQVKVVDQHALDRLFHLPAAEASVTPSTKGIEPQTLERIKRLFAEHPDSAMSVEEVVENVGISKTTGRRYLEYCVESGLISVEMLYGNIGHPRRGIDGDSTKVRQHTALVSFQCWIELFLIQRIVVGVVDDFLDVVNTISLEILRG